MAKTPGCPSQSPSFSSESAQRSFLSFATPQISVFLPALRAHASPPCVEAFESETCDGLYVGTSMSSFARIFSWNVSRALARWSTLLSISSVRISILQRRLCRSCRTPAPPMDGAAVARSLAFISSKDFDLPSPRDSDGGEEPLLGGSPPGDTCSLLPVGTPGVLLGGSPPGDTCSLLPVGTPGAERDGSRRPRMRVSTSKGGCTSKPSESVLTPAKRANLLVCTSEKCKFRRTLALRRTSSEDCTRMISLSIP